jgi:hypothetical protein
MKYTNRYNLPSAIVNNVLNDEYSRGDAVMSVTQLLNSPRIVLLQRVNEDKMEADVVDRLPSLLGTAMHKVLEKGANPGEIVEERFFLNILGWKISGAVDLQIPKDDGTWEINDYKLTSVYSVMVEKWEWEAQLNMYAYLAREAVGRRVSALKIVAILKDWNRKQGGFKADYPDAPIVMVDIPVWDDERQKKYIEDRVSLHQLNAHFLDTGKPIDYCTDQERWLRNEKWAAVKKGRKTAVKLFDTKEDADEWIKGQQDAANLTVEHRSGDPVRCSGNYCGVSSWCKQWLEQSDQGAGEGTGGTEERQPEQD